MKPFDNQNQQNMKPEELLSSVGETVEYGRLYLEQQKDYLQLEVAERLAKTTSQLVTLAVIAFFAFMVVIFLSLAGGLYLGAVLNSYPIGFLIITALYALTAVLVFYFKKSLVTNPILTIILKEMLD